MSGSTETDQRECLRCHANAHAQHVRRCQCGGLVVPCMVAIAERLRIALLHYADPGHWSSIDVAGGAIWKPAGPGWKIAQEAIDAIELP